MWNEYYIAFILISTVLFITVRSYLLTKSILKKSYSPIVFTVVIPFRNESGNLQRLIESFRNQTMQPREVIFVDDHSTDDSFQMLDTLCSMSDVYNLISLYDGQIGKKKAIELGVQKATGEYILTLDADTWFDTDFFESIVDSEKASMISGPVLLDPKGFMQHLYSLEHLFFNSFNYLIAPFYALSASGANLLFKRKDYIELNALQGHEKFLSGDDHFLLRNFQSKGLEIIVTNDPVKTVYTEVVPNFKAYLDQRIRWLGKTMRKTSYKELLFGSYISVYLLLGFILLLVSLIQSDFQSALMIGVTRFVLDGLILLIYTARMGKSKYIFLLPLFQVIYPFLFVVVVFGSIFYNPMWKGREVNK